MVGSRPECPGPRGPPSTDAALAGGPAQPQRWHQPGLGQDADRRLLVGVELDPLRRCSQQEGDHAVTTSQPPDLTAVAVDVHTGHLLTRWAGDLPTTCD